MGHGLMPYAIDWKRVTTLYGCGDETLLGVDPENSELIEDIVRGRPLDPDASEEYHFALAALCHTVGRRLTNDWFARTSFEHLADVEQGLQAIGATRFIFGVGVEADGAHDVGMDQAMDGRAFVLEVADVLRVSGNLDGDELVGPDVVVCLPHLAERSPADLLDQDVLADSLVRCRHP